MPAKGTGAVPKKFRTPEGCKVCGVPCFYNYYRVRCCEGCKQFFRRAIRNLRDYRCQRRGGQCNIEKGDRCLGCRLDKCLLVGMNAYQIKRQLAGAAAQQDAAAVAANDRTEEFLQKMAERRQQLLTALGIKLEPEMEMDEEEEEPEDQHQEEAELCKSKEEQKEEESQHSPCSELLPLIGPSSVPALGQDDDFRILDSLMRAEQKQRWVFDLLTDVPPGWLDAFDSLEQLVQSPVSLLELVDQSASQYKSDPRFDIENLTSKQDSDRINSGLGFINVDRTLLIDWAKTLPFFRQLEPEDQVTLVKHIAIQGATLCNSFYSATLGEETWTRTSGVKFINGFLSTPLANDKKLAQMHQRYLCDSVATIRQVDPSQEEFVLLLALLYCNSSAELSPAGRELLYTQSLKYTQMLMSLLQRRLGQMEGAKRFAECIFLLDVMGRMGHLFESMRSYQEMLYFRKMVRPVFPRALDAIM